MRTAIEVGVSGRGIYQDYALQQVDLKGRVAIPSRLRDTLLERNVVAGDARDASTIVTAIHGSDPCLIGYDIGYAKQLHAELLERARAHADATGAPRSAIMREAMLSDTMPFDASGRFILPPFPRQELNIGKYAFFIGLGDYFEIWDPATLIACDTAPQRMKAAVRFFMSEKGEAL
ncbi:MAG: hypothetical protein B7Y45_05190 [Sphingomonas sp. 28-66-16]|nr:MAG: hypothetical protein B7Y45_05190 [Sphingomonas sp. 28-66-16]